MKRIALIEGDTDLSLRLRLALEREGYAVSRFGSEREGLAAVRSGGFDFVIVDGDLGDAALEIPIVNLSKPVNISELLAHVAALWPETGDPDVYEDGSLRVDSRTFEVTLHGKRVKLARKELELLWLLVCNAPRVVARERIRSEVWHIAGDVETRTIDAHVRNLRKKIGAERVVTVVGEGYRYRVV
jgi:DNA-binding response OmpR family regulator